MSLHKTYMTVDGIGEVKVSISFNRDSHNWATSQPKKIGYYASVTPVKRTQVEGFTIEETGAFTGFNVCLFEIGRQSAKRLDTAITRLNLRVEEFANILKQCNMDYDKYIGGDDDGEFLGGMGGFVYVDKNGTPDIEMQCPICELGEDDNSMYGFESVAIKKGITFQHTIKDVSEGEAIMMTTDLKEPYRSAFLMKWLDRNYGDHRGVIKDIVSGSEFDADLVVEVYNKFNN